MHSLGKKKEKYTHLWIADDKARWYNDCEGYLTISSKIAYEFSL